jgi:hypothetical protein
LSARLKLNAAHLTGILITAISLGLGTHSISVGVLAAAALYAVSVSGGYIRTDHPPSGHYPRRRRRR